MNPAAPAPLGSATAGHCVCVCHASCPELTLSLHQLAESLGNAVDAKDHCTRSHSEEVAGLGRLLALRMDLGAHQAEIIHIAGHLHDIGKIGVPDAVLGKPGPLTPAEWEMVKLHPVIGADIVRPVAALTGPGGIADMILHHHERFDGAGYPHGLAGAAIPLGARIIAVADSLSAMLQRRPYKPPRALDEAVAEIAGLAGAQYDPQVVRALMACRGELAGALAQASQPAPANPRARQETTPCRPD
ncbi:MAG: HD-GYP domain-containing protein [Thermodesulfobacteriota bacterium]